MFRSPGFARVSRGLPWVSDTQRWRKPETLPSSVLHSSAFSARCWRVWGLRKHLRFAPNARHEPRVALVKLGRTLGFGTQARWACPALLGQGPEQACFQHGWVKVLAQRRRFCVASKRYGKARAALWDNRNLAIQGLWPSKAGLNVFSKHGIPHHSSVRQHGQASIGTGFRRTPPRTGRKARRHRAFLGVSDPRVRVVHVRVAWWPRCF